MEKIDLKDFVKSGEGANGSSYDCISNPDYMLKLYNADYPKDPIYYEQEIAEKVFKLGIASPEPGALVTDGERIGIRFRRVKGKRSYSRALADEPERVEEFSREFARYCKQLHARPCPEGLFPNAKDQFISLVRDGGKEYTEEEQNAIIEFIKSAPDACTCLHGDMHMGNVITTLPKGAPTSTPHEVCFIDLGYFGYGYPLFDLAMTYNICLTASEEFRRHDFHITGELTAKVWDYFADEYFFAEDHIAEKMFGKGTTKEQVVEKLLPYVCAKYFLVSFNLGFMPPEYDILIREVFGFGPKKA